MKTPLPFNLLTILGPTASSKGLTAGIYAVKGL